MQKILVQACSWRMRRLSFAIKFDFPTPLNDKYSASQEKVASIIIFGWPDFGAKMAQMGLVHPLLVGVPESRHRIWIYDIKDKNLRLWMHCPHALRVLPLLVRVPRSGGRSLLYRGDYHRHLAGTPISCIFLYTPVSFTILLQTAWSPPMTSILS